MAVTWNSVSVVKAYLSPSPKVDLNSRNSKGLTPLMVAASKGFGSMCELLLKNGADPALKNNSGLTAKEMAETHGYSAVALLLAPNTVDQPEEPQWEELSWEPKKTHSPINGKNIGVNAGSILESTITPKRYGEDWELFGEPPIKVHKPKETTSPVAIEDNSSVIRLALEDLAEEIRANYPTTAEESRLLNSRMIKLFLEKRPTCRDEFFDNFPRNIRTNINVEEAKDYLESVFEIFLYNEE